MTSNYVLESVRYLMLKAKQKQDQATQEDIIEQCNIWNIIY